MKKSGGGGGGGPIIIDKEDLSTIGGDWDNDSSQQQSSVLTFGEGNNNAKDSLAGSSLMGDLDEDDIAADREEYFKNNALVIDGFQCPNEFLTIITPMEFEEIVTLFLKFDTNKSGTIDKHETKKILNFLGFDHSLEKAEELLKIIDTDGSGEIDFNEFCQFFVMIKRGDERLSKYSGFMDKLHSTPLGELERQAKYRDLRINFRIVEIREASLTNPTLYVVEVDLAGYWHSVQNGEISSSYGVRKFQGMGNNVREAKYAAANAALVNMGSAMPGIKFLPGEFPEEWLKWVDDNLLRGVDPGKIVSILASKGFHPYRNTRLMHRIISWHSLLKFVELHPHIDVNDTDEPFDEEFLEWIRKTAEKGIDGAILYELLQDRYIDLTKHHLYFAQKLQNNEIGCVMGADGRPAYLLDLHHAYLLVY